MKKLRRRKKRNKQIELASASASVICGIPGCKGLAGVAIGDCPKSSRISTSVGRYRAQLIP